MSDKLKVMTSEDLRDIIVKGKYPLDILDVSSIQDMRRLFKGIDKIN